MLPPVPSIFDADFPDAAPVGGAVFSMLPSWSDFEESFRAFMSKYNLNEQRYFNMLEQLLKSGQYDAFVIILKEAGLSCEAIMDLCESNAAMRAQCDKELWERLIVFYFGREPNTRKPGETLEQMHERLCLSQEDRKRVEANFDVLVREYQRHLQDYGRAARRERGMQAYRLVGIGYAQRLRALRREIDKLLALMQDLDPQSRIFQRVISDLPPQLRAEASPSVGSRERRTSTNEPRRRSSYRGEGPSASNA